jgi:hypothetical protein
MAIAPGHPEPTIASDEQRRRSARLLVLDERSRLRLFAQLPAHMRVGRQREAERPLVGTAQFTRKRQSRPGGGEAVQLHGTRHCRWHDCRAPRVGLTHGIALRERAPKVQRTRRRCTSRRRRRPPPIRSPRSRSVAESCGWATGRIRPLCRAGSAASRPAGVAAFLLRPRCPPARWAAT